MIQAFLSQDFMHPTVNCGNDVFTIPMNDCFHEKSSLVSLDDLKSLKAGDEELRNDDGMNVILSPRDISRKLKIQWRCDPGSSETGSGKT